MVACCCSLSGTAACLTCPNGSQYQGYHSFKIVRPVDDNCEVKKVKRIIEKFDEKGNLIERITEE